MKSAGLIFILLLCFFDFLVFVHELVNKLGRIGVSQIHGFQWVRVVVVRYWRLRLVILFGCDRH